MNARNILVAATLVGLLGLVRADEKKLKESDVPKAVVDAVKKKYPKATIKQWEKDTKKDEKGETVLYEASLEDGKRKIDVELNSDGKFVCEEEQIEQSALPDKVKKGLADSKYGKWAVKRTEKVVHDEKDADAAFELIVTSEDEKYEIVFDKDGKLTKEEKKKVKKEKKGEKDDDDDDDDD